MPFWPFRKPAPEPLTPEQLRARLIDTAATGSRRQLRSLCRQYREQIATQVDFLRKIPEGLPQNDGSIDRHVQSLIAVAQCLARDCAAPELWNRLNGDLDGNPLTRFDQWVGALPQRMEQLEYDELITEARGFVDEFAKLRGSGAQHQQALANGRLGQLLFHSGRVADSGPVFDNALKLCRGAGDLEGQIAYLTALIEVHRYLGDGQVLTLAAQLRDVRRSQGQSVDAIEKQLTMLRAGEPLCRVICLRNGQEFELDEITSVGQGSYKFHFRRNRPTLEIVTALTRQGSQLASQGELAAALEKYQAAADIDPYDPDPVFLQAVCLLELGAYTQAKAALEEVERLAPGWFRCRSDHWIASGLEDGSISLEQWQVLRGLEDAGLKPPQIESIARQAISRFPDFAPFYLTAGDAALRRGDQPGAIAVYRRGLELSQEPDVESRLACALAANLPAGSPERAELIARTLRLKGSLVSQATARLLALK